MKHVLFFAAVVAAAHTSTAAYFADQVIEYTPGNGVGALTNQLAALGSPNPTMGSGEYAGVLSPFSPHYEASQIVSIGSGGSLTLRLSNFVSIDRSPGVFEIGIWSNVGLIDPIFTDTVVQTGDPAQAFGIDSAVVEVSADNVTWYSLNGGEPILFTLPGNYFTNAGPFGPVPAEPQFADFGKPFTGSLSDFNGKTDTEIVAALNGSAGGTWLDLDSVPLAQVGYIRFKDVKQNTQISGPETLEIDAVSINSSLAGAAVPEPSAGILSMIGVGTIGVFRRKRI